MEKLLSLALVVLDGLALERRAFNTRRLTMAALLTALSGLALLGATGCAVAALWIYLAAAYGPVGGALGSTTVLLILSGALFVAARGQFREGERLAPPKPSLADELTGEAQRLFLRHKGSALLTALLAGLAAGRSK